MKPKLCIIGSHHTIQIAQEVGAEFLTMADFSFIVYSFGDPFPKNDIENLTDIILTGPSIKQTCSNQLTIPIIPMLPTYHDLLIAIQEAKEYDTSMAICLTREDADFDFALLSRIMNVSITPLYCDEPQEYINACKFSQSKGIKVIIGANFAVKEAERIDIKGIYLYKGPDRIRVAVKKAIELWQIQNEGIRRISQLSGIMNNVNEGLILTDEKGQIILNNPLAEKYLKITPLKNNNVSNLFQCGIVDQVLRKGDKFLNIIEKNELIVDYVPVKSNKGIHGIVCILKKIAELQETEFRIRTRLHERGLVSKYTLDDIIGESQGIRSCKEYAAIFAVTHDPILITGESGTGKELFAHSIHGLSKRSQGPFVAVNCASLPHELLESELFGYEKGAFTGAYKSKKGLIELAHRGTLFLDEITSLDYSLQAKLLRVLSEYELLKLGSDQIIPVDVRIIAATNSDIESEAIAGRFRSDLYYRLNVLHLRIAPLRERPEDLIPLFYHFLYKTRGQIDEELIKRQSHILNVLIKEQFKGNVRELENIAKRFCLMYRPQKDIENIEGVLGLCVARRTIPVHLTNFPNDLHAAMQAFEKTIIEDMIRRIKNKDDISRALNVDRSTLWRKTKKYKISSE
jgi:propionate catabolism operon transcriptional regulator